MQQVTLPPLSPERARWRRWAARSERHRATYGRWLPLLPREPCWERRPTRVNVRAEHSVDAEREIVRPYVAAYLGEGEAVTGTSEQSEARHPDPVSATFGGWLDHVLACDDCHRTPARHCYHGERLADRHREATSAARPQR